MVAEVVPIEEAVLISRARDGDQEAFRQLVERYQGAVYNLAYRMLGEHGDVDDCVQEIFMRAFRGLKEFRGDSSLKTWIYRIATNTCLNYLDRNKRQPSVDSLDEPLGLDSQDTRGDQLASQQRSPEELLAGIELEEAIQETLNHLPPDFRTALVLRDVEGMSYEEVSQLTGVTLGTVKSRIARARSMAMRKLREYLG